MGYGARYFALGLVAVKNDSELRILLSHLTDENISRLRKGK